MNQIKSEDAGEQYELTSDRMRLTDSFPDLANQMKNQDDLRKRADEMNI